MATDLHGDRVLAEFSLPSEPGNERLALARVADSVAELHLAPRRVERLKTAVAEATMNAIEHGNHNRADLPVDVRVLRTESDVVVSITDRGGDSSQGAPAATPDLEAKLAGLQTPRGWGLFLIRSMVDAMDVSSDHSTHTVTLTVAIGDDADA